MRNNSFYNLLLMGAGNHLNTLSWEHGSQNDLSEHPNCLPRQGRKVIGSQAKIPPFKPASHTPEEELILSRMAYTT